MNIRHFSDEQRILHRILLEAPFVKDPGVLYGQTGIILALARRYQETSNSFYEDAVSFLIDKLMDNVSETLPLDFGRGLAGIGWGLEYLLQQGLIEGDCIEICSEIDNRIMQENVKYITDLSLETGLEGKLHYVLAHIQGCKSQHKKHPFAKDFLEDWFFKINTLHGNISPELSILTQQYKEFYCTGFISYNNFDLKPLVRVTNWESDILSGSLGLREGLAGRLLINFS